MLLNPGAIEAKNEKKRNKKSRKETRQKSKSYRLCSYVKIKREKSDDD